MLPSDVLQKKNKQTIFGCKRSHCISNGTSTKFSNGAPMQTVLKERSDVLKLKYRSSKL